MPNVSQSELQSTLPLSHITNETEPSSKDRRSRYKLSTPDVDPFKLPSALTNQSTLRGLCSTSNNQYLRKCRGRPVSYSFTDDEIMPLNLSHSLNNSDDLNSIESNNFKGMCGGNFTFYIVEVPNLIPPPQYLLDLYKGDSSKSKNFVENIRCYNMMFSFTSIGGKIDHKINSGRGPYVYRISRTANSCSNSYSIEFSTLNELKGLLDATNPLVQKFRMARNRFALNEEEPIRIKLIGSSDKDGRTHNLITANEVAAIVVGDIDGTADQRDIILETRSRKLKRIKDGYGTDVYHRGVDAETDFGHIKLTLREFFAYRLQARVGETYLILLSKKLLQQFIVDAYTMVENTRLNYILNNQKILRVSPCSDLYDAQESGHQEASNIGNRVILPSSFTGGARPDISTRVFKIKLDSLMRKFRVEKIFGKVVADHVPGPDDVDNFITAELPDKNVDPDLYSIVSEFMIHGPCGPNHKHSPCMTKKGQCSKHFPKDFHSETHFDGDGYPRYKIRDDGNFVVKGTTNLDNRYVVPYNKQLLKQYQAHINVEWCNQIESIKYLFKYINKGPDRITISIQDSNAKKSHARDSNSKDEIATYYSCRYLSSCEASWRLFNFDIVHRTPAVYRLQFHLPNHEPIYYDNDEVVENVLLKPSVGTS
ncbi:uncharacterized protein [Rutidosis leptorrhynchoides]|uniref:uncharacterized protein n=1 Tax=Rutidosis leptorrhynchoides TaxID=125765 RepID=UPI003A9A1291